MVTLICPYFNVQKVWKKVVSDKTVFRSVSDDYTDLINLQVSQY